MKLVSALELVSQETKKAEFQKNGECKLRVIFEFEVQWTWTITKLITMKEINFFFVLLNNGMRTSAMKKIRWEPWA